MRNRVLIALVVLLILTSFINWCEIYVRQARFASYTTRGFHEELLETKVTTIGVQLRAEPLHYRFLPKGE